MGIHWVAAIFFAAQAAPLAWRGPHADRQTVWSLCSGLFAQESISQFILSSFDLYAGRRNLKELGSAV